MTLRRSQRLCAQLPGRENGHESPTRNKRRYRSEDIPQNALEPKPKRRQLTASNLRRHQQENDLGQMGRTRKIPAGSASSKTSTTTTDKNFGLCLQENNVVYLWSLTEPPDDCERLQKALLEEHEVPASAHKIWGKMVVAGKCMGDSELSLESRVIETMLTQHHNDTPDEYARFRNDAWTEVDNEITVGISDAKPDVVETYFWAAYPKGTQEEFDDLVVTQYGYAMPTFAMESKGPAGLPNQAVKQAAYDGALMTHAALAVDSILGRGPSQKYRKTKAITVTLDDISITVYANHAVLVEDSGKEEIHYHQYKLAKVDYMDSKAAWERAHSLLHNAQELGMRLANARISSIKTYFDDKKATSAELKAKQADLQKQARAKVHTATTAISPKDNDNTSTTHHSKKQRSEIHSEPRKNAVQAPLSPKPDGTSEDCDRPPVRTPQSLDL